MTKFLQSAFVLCSLAISLSACDNKESSVGVDIQPSSTKLSTFAKNFEVVAETVPLNLKPGITSGDNSIYVNSPISYIGKLPDKFFNTISCDYLCQFYIPKGFKFTETPYNGKIDSTKVELYYTAFEGDSISPLSIAAFKIGKQIPRDRYSINSLNDFEPMTLLGRRAFLPKYGNSTNTNPQNEVLIGTIKINNSLGQDIYNKSVNNSPVFSSQENFNEYFPGIYLTAQAGSGAILEVVRTAISIYFKVERTTKSSKGVDSTYITTSKQNIIYTPEVNMLARFRNKGIQELIAKGQPKADKNYYTYLKSPAGVLTQLTVPTKELSKLIKSAPVGKTRQLASVPFTLLAEPSQNDIYNLPTPKNLLLIPKDSVESFFEHHKTELSAPYTSFLSEAYSQASTSYSFSNISSLIQKQIDTNPNEDLKLWVIPVNTSKVQTNNGSNITSSINNLIKPTGLKIKFSSKSRTFKVIYTERDLKNN